MLEYLKEKVIDDVHVIIYCGRGANINMSTTTCATSGAGTIYFSG